MKDFKKQCEEASNEQLSQTLLTIKNEVIVANFRKFAEFIEKSDDTPMSFDLFFKKINEEHKKLIIAYEEYKKREF